MNWSKIKTIMIYFLLAMNLFLIAFTAVSMWRESSVPDDVIKASVKILEKDGFSCEKSLIPTTTHDLPVLNASFYSESELSEIFFDRQLAFKTAGNSLVAEADGGTLTVTANHFVFETVSPPDESHSSGKIKRALKKAGIDMTGAVYDEDERCFYRMYGGVNLFDMGLRAELDRKGKLCYVSALWPGKLTAQEATVLSFSSSVKKVKGVFPEGGTIELIEPGYALIPMGGNRYTFKPSWRVEVGNEMKILQ